MSIHELEPDTDNRIQDHLRSLERIFESPKGDAEQQLRQQVLPRSLVLSAAVLARRGYGISRQAEEAAYEALGISEFHWAAALRDTRAALPDDISPRWPVEASAALAEEIRQTPPRGFNKLNEVLQQAIRHDPSPDQLRYWANMALAEFKLSPDEASASRTGKFAIAYD